MRKLSTMSRHEVRIHWYGWLKHFYISSKPRMTTKTRSLRSFCNCVGWFVTWGRRTDFATLTQDGDTLELQAGYSNHLKSTHSIYFELNMLAVVTGSCHRAFKSWDTDIFGGNDLFANKLILYFSNSDSGVFGITLGILKAASIIVDWLKRFGLTWMVWVEWAKLTMLLAVVWIFKAKTGGVDREMPFLVYLICCWKLWVQLSRRVP